MRPALALVACALLAIPAAAVGIQAPLAQRLPMQADLDSPIWSTLQAMPYSRAGWAELLTRDADGNGRTDFLDLSLAAAGATGQLAEPVELLVYGDAATRERLAADHPGSVPIDAADALFMTVPFGQVPALAVPGVSLVVWEPRVWATSSTNPAGGSPAALPQITMHQGNSAWTAGYTGSGVKIAIIDTGVDPNHDALAGSKVTAFKDCIGSGATAYDDHGHGTHVASIAAGDDGTDFRGIAYQASVVGVKVLDFNGSGSLASFNCGVAWLANSGSPRADVASMSAGLGVPPLAITTLNGGETDLFAWDRQAEVLPNTYDVPFTVAAGNWIGTGIEVLGLSESLPVGINGVNQVSSPGFASKVLTIGAVDQYQTSGTFTAVGPGKTGHLYKPDVAAMGVLTWGALKGTTHSYDTWSGTSMATPLAAGVTALLVQKNGALAHTAYENAMRNGARPACLVATSSACYLGLATMQPDPNFVVGEGVVKASNSLALV